MASPELIQSIDRATQSIQEGFTPRWSDSENEKLLASANRLVASLERTEDRAWRIITAPTIQAALVAVTRMGVFEAFRGKERKSAAEIAAEIGADRQLLVRLMRALLVNNIFEEVGEEQYAQNALSKTLSEKVFQTFLKLSALTDTWMPQLANFLESLHFQNPVEPDNGLLQFAAQTKLSTMDWFKTNPKVLELISNSMAALYELKP